MITSPCQPRRRRAPRAARSSSAFLALPQSGRPPAPRPQSRAGDQPVAARRVLIVDDDQDFADGVADAIALLGHLPTVAGDAAQARAAAERGRFDLVLLDIRLGREDGLALLPHLAATAARVVVVSGAISPDDERRARAGGAAGLQRKPVSVSALAGLLGAAP